MSLIAIWYRQSFDADGARATQFVSLTMDGQRRIETILAASTQTRRLAGQVQNLGQEDESDQSSEPK